MKVAEYSRHLTTLTTSGVVTFSKRTELIEFFSMLMGEKYDQYLRRLRGMTATERKMRRASGPSLVRLATTTFLNDRVPDEENDAIGRWLKKVFRRKQEIFIDNDAKTELYEFVLKKVGHGDAVNSVFTDDMLYTIEGEKTLKMVHI